ncbi:unnamed protein product [Dovyalis caffra]|uniref:BHLH domain-containing protein n=1 Tax=Dovyalis caffra TaxID=77055 RepID=A0AAV1SMX6_9ROSI|nr:unnamed protein product [Dovyalis caffra]
MALEAVVFQQDPFSTLGLGATWIHGFGTLEGEKANYHETLNTAIGIGSDFHSNDNWNTNNSSSQENDCACNGRFFTGGNAAAGRQKRRRRRSIKDAAEVAHQRMTHINVERNRRKQMNDYLAAIRSMIPPSYVQRADQASIVGGAINFVKELEKLLQSLEAHKQIKKVPSATDSDLSSPFSDFFSFPQYSTASSRNKHSNNSSSSTESILPDQKRSIAIADVEVTMIESHVNLKIQSRKQPKQLLKMVAGLHSLGLYILHLNLTTVDQTVLFSFNVKVEDECRLTSVDEIAEAVHEMVGRIQEDATSNCMSSIE